MIVKTITDEYYFWNWAKNSDSYKDNFSLEGSKAVFNYFDQLSDELGETMEFDPIAWCCEFSEYKDFDEFQHDTGYTQNGVQHKGYDNINSLDELKDNTTVVEFDGGILVAEF